MRTSTVLCQLENVGTGAFDDLQLQGGLAVERRVAGCVLVSAADFGHVRQGHRGIVRAFDRQVERILGGSDQAGHLDGKAAFAGVDLASRDELVVRGHDGVDVLIGQIVSFKFDGIDHNFEHVFALANNVGFQHARIALQHVLQGLGNLVQSALRRLAEQVHDHDREL